MRPLRRRPIPGSPRGRRRPRLRTRHPVLRPAEPHRSRPARRPVHMACSGIGLTRCPQTFADPHRHRHGLRWKPGTGPADLHLIVAARRPAGDAPAHRPGRQAAPAPRHPLLVDDRHEAAGEKFACAQLIGLPALSSSPRSRPTAASKSSTAGPADTTRHRWSACPPRSTADSPPTAGPIRATGCRRAFHRRHPEFARPKRLETAMELIRGGSVRGKSP